MFRRFVGRSTPPPEPPSVVQQVSLLLKVELLPLWLFWQNLRAMRPWWPVLLPLLLVYGVRAYRRERREAAAQRAAGEQG